MSVNMDLSQFEADVHLRSFKGRGHSLRIFTSKEKCINVPAMLDAVPITFPAPESKIMFYEFYVLALHVSATDDQ